MGALQLPRSGGQPEQQQLHAGLYRPETHFDLGIEGGHGGECATQSGRG